MNSNKQVGASYKTRKKYESKEPYSKKTKKPGQGRFFQNSSDSNSICKSDCKKIKPSEFQCSNGIEYDSASPTRAAIFTRIKSAQTGKRVTASIENLLSPKRMTTRELLMNGECLQAAMEKLHTLQTVPNSFRKVAKDLGMEWGIGEYSRNGESSSCGAIGQKVCNRKENNGRLNCKEHIHDCTGEESCYSDEARSFNEVEDKDKQNSIHISDMLNEMLLRSEKIMEQADEYVPQGDEFDLSPDSLCMLRVFPQYAEKSRNNKKMEKKIKSLTFDEISQMYSSFAHAELGDVTTGRVASHRMNLFKEYIEGSNIGEAIKELRDNFIRNPFTEEQTFHCLELIGNDDAHALLQIMDVKTQCSYQLTSDLHFYVLLPETLVRIYAKVNHMTHQNAEEAMRWGALKDDKYPPLE